MNGSLKSGEQFRRGFVLLMTTAYAVAFLAMLGGFSQALLLAAVFSGLVYPLYLRLKKKLGDRDTLAALLTIYPGAACHRCASDQPAWCFT